MTSASLSQVAARTRAIATDSERSLRIAKFVWLLILISFMTFRHREAEDLLKSGGIDAQAKFQIVAWLGFGLLALRLMLSGRTDFKLLVHPPLVWLVVFVLTAVASTMYSISPPLTLFRSGQLVIAILLVISLREHSNRFIESSIGMGILGLLSTSMVLLTLFISLACVIKLPPDHTGISPGWEPVAMAIPMLGFCILDRGFASPADPFLFIFTAMLTHTTKLLLAHSARSEQTEPTVSPSF